MDRNHKRGRVERNKRKHENFFFSLNSCLSDWGKHKKMKTINVTFEDKEVKFLNNIKKDKNWRNFILGLAQYKD